MDGASPRIMGPPRQSTNAGSGSGGSGRFVRFGAGLISARTVCRRCCLTNKSRTFSIADYSPKFSCRHAWRLPRVGSLVLESRRRSILCLSFKARFICSSKPPLNRRIARTGFGARVRLAASSPVRCSPAAVLRCGFRARPCTESGPCKTCVEAAPKSR